jgi:hypothetical protein
MNFSTLHREMAASKLLLITEQISVYSLLTYNQTKADNLQFTLSAMKDLAVMLDIETKGSVIIERADGTISHQLGYMFQALVTDQPLDFLNAYFECLAKLRSMIWQLHNEMAEV